MSRAGDGELLRRARRDADAFAELYARHERVVATFLRRRTGDAELTADLTAETFATALVHAGRFRDDGPAVGWLLGIATKLHLKLLRRGRAERRATERLGIRDRPPLSSASQDRIDELADAARARRPLLHALDELPEAQRQAIVGYVLDDLSYAELSAALGVPEPTLRQRVRRGLARLRIDLEGARS